MAIDNQHHLPIAYLPKRQKSPQNDAPPRLRHDSYSVAWICALPIEMAAAQAMLAETHETLPTDADDTNTYVLGRIEKHNVVIACLPATQYGTNNAANVATNLIRTFPSIRAGLIVGIGGGVPRNLDMRLGDIVVGTRVMQYDLGKVVGVGQFQRAAVPRIPHHLLGTAVSSLRAKHELGPSRVFAILHEKLRRYSGYARPALPDLLFEATYDHVSSTANCDECNQSRVLPRGRRAPDDVVIHYGAIASGNQVMRSGKMRDEVASQLDVKCFEMEAAGLMDILPCLPIRGICDYSDSHKIKGWQKYAAAAAAAYATELLGELPLSEGRATDDYLLDPNQKYKNRKRLMDTLRFDRMQYRMKSMLKEHSRTCRWLLRHPKYKAWTDPQQLRQHHGFLWISGKPGAGKSTIMKYAYLKMKSKASLENHMTASFFFNARGEWLERSVGGMYRALLLQLLEGYPDLQSVLDNPDLISSDQSYCPSYSTLKDLLHNATMELRKRPFTCFVDALDECDEQQVVDMVQYFEDLAEESAAAGGQLRICFSSRHYPHIIIERGLSITLENEPGHASDMEAYLDSRLLIGDAKLLQELKSQILERAAGVFMWIVLVVTILNKEYRRGGQALRKRLAEIPGDLSRLFRDILERDNENMEQFALAIWWILYAKRPLRPDEFYHALWSGLRQRDLVDPQVPDFSSLNPEERANIFNSYVVSSSKGLAEAPVTKQGPPTVQFIHESVRDFLIKDKALLELYPDLSFEDESNGHEILKQCCNAYINDELVYRTVHALQQSELGIETSKETKLMQEKYPFLEYAAGNVLYHADAAASSISQDEFLSAFKTSHWIHTSNVFQMNWDWLYSSDASLFYIFADRGHSHLIRTRLKIDRQVHVKGERYKYPLFAAVANGNRDGLAALLNLSSHIYNGVDVTESLMYRKRLKWYEGRTPVSWSAEAGGTAMVKLLLESGLPMDNVDEDGRTPLSRSCETGMENVARLLIQLGAAIESRSRIGITPLGWACVAGQLAVVKLLIESGASVDTRDIYGRTVLFLASLNRYEDVASLLIDKGADVNAMDIEGNTPLLSGLGRVTGVYYANSMKECNGDYQPMKIDRGPFVRLLVEHGAEVNASNKYGHTPLLAASENGFDDIVKILLERGASVNIIDGEGQAPLSRAVADWHVVTTKILLENGAHVNHRGPDGSTPLLQASRMGHGPSVEVLLENGADPNVGNFRNSTPLLEAARLGSGQVCTMLINGGADIHAKDITGSTALLEAVATGHFDLVMLFLVNRAHWGLGDQAGTTPRLLASLGEDALARLRLEDGADPNVRDLEGASPLHNAAFFGYANISKLLIERGADPNARDLQGWSALHKAAFHGHADVCKTLIENGAEVDIKGSDGLTPTDVAAQKGRQSVVDMMMQNGARRPG